MCSKACLRAINMIADLPTLKFLKKTWRLAWTVSYNDCGPLVGLTTLIFFLVCAAIWSSHSPLITLALLSSESLLLLKNETVFRTRYTFYFTVRKWSVTVRQWNRGQNREAWKICDWMLNVKYRLCVTDHVNKHLLKKTRENISDTKICIILQIYGWILFPTNVSFLKVTSSI